MVVCYHMGLVVSVVGIVEGSSILLIMEGYFVLDGFFYCVPVLSFYGCYYVFDEVMYL